MHCPAEFYTPSPRPYAGLPALDYPFHDKAVTVTTCGRICFNRQKINLSQVFAGQTVGIKQVDDRLCRNASGSRLKASAIFSRLSAKQFRTLICDGAGSKLRYSSRNQRIRSS